MKITLFNSDDFKSKVERQAYEGDDLEVGLIKDAIGVKAIDKDRREATFVISDGEVDRHRDTVAVNGWDLSSYRKNPVVLWAHNSHSPPIGASLRVKREGGQLVSTARFSKENPMADLVFRMIDEKMLRATSVGFRPLKFDWVQDDEERRGGIDFHKQELLEWSVVPVPANPRAIIQLHGMKVDTSPLKEWAESVLDAHEKIRGLGINDIEEAWKALNGSGTTFSFPKVEEKGIECEVDLGEEATISVKDLPAKADAELTWKDGTLISARFGDAFGDSAKKILDQINGLGIEEAEKKLSAEKAEVRVEVREKEVVVRRDPTVLEALEMVRDFYEQCGDDPTVGTIEADLRKFKAAGVTPRLESRVAPDDEDPDETFTREFGDDEPVTVSDELAEMINTSSETIEVDEETYNLVCGEKGSALDAVGHGSSKED